MLLSKKIKSHADPKTNEYRTYDSNEFFTFIRINLNKFVQKKIVRLLLNKNFRVLFTSTGTL